MADMPLASRGLRFRENYRREKRMNRGIVVVGLCLLVVQGCATKHYGRVGTVTEFERQAMTCREIALEQARVNGFRQQIDQESQFDVRSILAFLGDFGIGNALEQNAATENASARAAALQALSAQRGCVSQTVAARAAQPEMAPAPQPGRYSATVEALAQRDLCMPVGHALVTGTSQAGDTYQVNCMGGMTREYACAGQSCGVAR